MDFALKSFQIYTDLSLAAHIANVSGFSLVIAHAVIPILQRGKTFPPTSLPPPITLTWKVDIKLMSKACVHATFIIYRGTWFSPL